MQNNTISKVLDLRRNNFDFLRFFLAILVIFHHTFPLGGFGEDPINTLTNYKESAGSIAVAGFFIISGFLITKSLVESNSFTSFGAKRFLRIFPGFWTCLIITAFVFAPIVFFVENKTLVGFLTADRGPINYVKVNFFLLMHEYSIAGLLSHSPHKTTFDGSLWTLFLEAKAYVAIFLLGIIGLSKNKKFTVPLIFLLLWFLILLRVPIHDSSNKFLRLIIDGSFLFYATYFFAGATLFLFSNKIPLNKYIFILALFVALISIPLGLVHFVMPITLPLIILWLAAFLPFSQFAIFGDFSYGIYIYAFPIQQLISFFNLNYDTISYFLLSVALTMIFAVGSWFLIEKPALSLKRYLKTLNTRKIITGISITTEKITE